MDLFGPAWTCLDAFECIWMHRDALGCEWPTLEKSHFLANFGIFVWLFDEKRYEVLLEISISIILVEEG